MTSMTLGDGSAWLVAAAVMDALAALAHLACIALGAPAYRRMGAGEKMARMAEAGKLEPTVATLAISGVLLVWAAFASSGAGLIGPLPFTGAALVAISGVYLARAVAFPLLKSAFPDNSMTFWWVSSGICLVMGVVHAVGTALTWARL